jgi:hypothetical protein
MGMKKTKKPKKVRKPKFKPFKSIIRNLDAVFSRYIRARDKGVCFTCNVKKPINEMQAGHYVSRSYKSLRWDERNVNCQCLPCNVFKHGNLDAYALKLIAKYGPNILYELQIQKQRIVRHTRAELEALIQHYTDRAGVL